MECFSNTELLLQKGETGQEGTTNHIVVWIKNNAFELSRHNSGISLRHIFIRDVSLSSLI